MDYPKLRKTGAWVLKIVLGLLFVMAGSGKFTAAEVWGQKFIDWGLPAALSYAIGAVELAAGILLFVPKLTRYAILILVAVMLGAAATHIFNLEFAEVLRPGIFLGMLFGLLVLTKMTRGGA